MTSIGFEGYEYPFVLHLKRLWAQHLQVASTDSHLQSIDRYLSDKIFPTGDVDCRLIIRQASTNLVIESFSSILKITVDPNVKVGKYKLITLCKLINDGNIDIKGYPIFTQTAQTLIDTLDGLYYTWKEQTCL